MLYILRQVFIGEINPRLSMGKYVDQLSPPCLEPVGQPAAKLRQRLAPLGIGARINEIGNRLGLSQIDLAGQERPLRELPGLGQPQTGQRR